MSFMVWVGMRDCGIWVCMSFCLIHAMYEATIAKRSTEWLIQLCSNCQARGGQDQVEKHTASAGHGSQAPNGVHIRLVALSCAGSARRGSWAFEHRRRPSQKRIILKLS